MREIDDGIATRTDDATGIALIDPPLLTTTLADDRALTSQKFGAQEAPLALALADRNPDARFHHFSYGHDGFSHPDARRRILDVVADRLTEPSEDTP